MCDFTCDCSTCSDENNCGYSGRSFACDFEDVMRCGWVSEASHPNYQWEAAQRGASQSPSGPSSDYTTGTATGWYMGLTAVTSDALETAELRSPLMNNSAPTCRLHLRYFTWDAGHTGLGPVPLWASVLRENGEGLLVWRPGSSSVDGWREADIFLGRIPSRFRINLHSQRAVGLRGDVAIDQLEFLDCALPAPSPGGGCAEGMLQCARGGCVAQRQVCDGTDDCGDGTDEQTCEDYWACDFEDGLCDWDLRSFSPLKWNRTTQNLISTTDPLKGPGRDHSTNSASGHFLYVTVPEGGLGADWAAFQTPLLEPTNSTHPCKLVLYSHQFGPRAGGLAIMVASKTITPVWERGGALGDLWVKAEVEVVSSTAFKLLVMAAIRDAEYGGIGVDSLRLSPECRRSTGNVTLEEFPNPPEDPCTPDSSKMCDFEADCKDAADEAECGDFSYAQGSSGWTDRSVGSQGWKLHKTSNSTTKEEYLYVSEAPGQQLTEAQSLSPPLGPSGPACTLNFSYALTGTPDHIGELSVRLIDSLLGVLPKLWEFSGRTGAEETAWRTAEVAVGHRQYRFHLAFEARATTLSHNAKIRVKDVRYHNCHANYFPLPPSAMSCNFEDGLCGWYQDHSDNFDWTLLSGMDHTIRIGKSLVVDFWDPNLRGASGRLRSFPLEAFPEERCLAFFYKLYGTQTGVLNVKVMDSNGFELLLWTRSGAHGNFWHEEQCPVPHQLTKFQLVFEVVRSGFDGRVAIDDVALLERPCSLPRLCSFEGQPCGYTSSGDVRWAHRNGHMAAHAGGPKTDHTLETELGFFMMVHSGRDDLRPDGRTALTSPVQSGSAHTQCVHFWYHTGGSRPGLFSVYMKPVTGDRVKIFSNNLNQGDVWRHGNANISSELVDWQLEFEVVGVGGKDTHVAIDDVSLMAHPCDGEGARCTLEHGLCGWSNTNLLDWDITSGETETHYDVPLQDHLGAEQGHFLFFPSSSRTPANQNARLVSVHLPPTKGTCLKFWAHRLSSADNLLKVWRLTGVNQLHHLLTVKEVGGPWVRFNVSITSTHSYQIVLEGIQGTAGLLALDDIQYTVGTDCEGRVTDPLETGGQRDQNTGGVAASVVVFLFLLGTLAALLVFYLHTRQKANQLLPGQAAGQSEVSSRAKGFNNEGYTPENEVSFISTEIQIRFDMW
ncbi:Apical endosomal glycoprotein [Merluccius polli]|uniref:Apical endosomal glycoprotein n=1 Tax=Merluccius polli TaxID=89951 RepID=A0AA47LZ46_MERPO|nr:Apical endosomal glycoprotein [Merluccius polli]